MPSAPPKIQNEATEVGAAYLTYCRGNQRCLSVAAHVILAQTPGNTFCGIPISVSPNTMYWDDRPNQLIGAEWEAGA